MPFNNKDIDFRRSSVSSVETTASFSFAGVSDINILSSQGREIIDKIQEISVLLSAGKEEQQIMSRTIAAFPTLV